MLWNFNDDSRLLGLHGTTTNGVITSLGVVHDTSAGCSSTSNVSYGDNEQCPCLTNNGIRKVVGTSGNVIVYTHDDGLEYEYPSNYGTSCEAWDENLPPYCNVSDPPSWCLSDWCYVDPSVCTKSDLERTTFFKEDLHYSYQNCGTYLSFGLSSDSANGKSDANVLISSAALGLAISALTIL